MVAVKIPISLTIILILSLSVHSALGDRPIETTNPSTGCYTIPKKAFNFLPCRTDTVGMYCAALHGENAHECRGTNYCYNWVGKITIIGKCGVCCARGNGSDPIYYSFFENVPKEICEKRKKEA
uniref:Putative secreted protein n=1 Tax=Amblyomma americanum TaxID=6943 RepID=A0A0C9RWM5_AMBAM